MCEGKLRYLNVMIIALNTCIYSRYAASVILSLVYGKKTPTRFSDPEVVAMNLSMKRIADCLRPGACLVDRFPFLKYLPTPETRRLRSYRDEWMALFRSQFDVIRRQIVRCLLDFF